MSTLQIVICCQIASTIMMTGLIWFVQLVHYPLMREVGQSTFRAYELENMRRTTWIVAPLMSIEAICAITLVFLSEQDHSKALAFVGLSLVGVIWTSTVWLQMPCHRRLAMGFDAQTVDRLIATNWIRTAAWSARTGIAIVIPLLLRT